MRVLLYSSFSFSVNSFRCVHAYILCYKYLFGGFPWKAIMSRVVSFRSRLLCFRRNFGITTGNVDVIRNKEKCEVESKNYIRCIFTLGYFSHWNQVWAAVVLPRDRPLHSSYLHMKPLSNRTWFKYYDKPVTGYRTFVLKNFWALTKYHCLDLQIPFSVRLSLKKKRKIYMYINYVYVLLKLNLRWCVIFSTLKKIHEYWSGCDVLGLFFLQCNSSHVSCNE